MYPLGRTRCGPIGDDSTAAPLGFVDAVAGASVIAEGLSERGLTVWPSGIDSGDVRSAV